MFKMSIFEISNNKDYKDLLIKDLSIGISNADEFKIYCEYVLDNKIKLFDISEFKESPYDNEDYILDLIMPCFRRVWAKVYIQPPNLFNLNFKDDKRLDLFQSYFNVDEFSDYFISMFKKTKGCLLDFEYIDRTPQHFSIIVDNYIAFLLKKVMESDIEKVNTKSKEIKKMSK